MKTISKRELNQQTARVLAAVDAGETVVVTERGIVRWRIEAVGTESDPVARLRAQGRIIASRADPAPWPEAETDAPYSPERVDQLYADSRGDH
ncbi:MAG: type II toxin-antitoxin system Phd/YefM family antitoxin [Nocardioides sp.]